jgi:hypothetical protein
MSNLRITEYDPGMSNPNPPAAAPRWIRWLGLAGLVAYGIFMAWYYVPSAGGADSSGYLNSAKLLAQGKMVTQSRVIPELKLASPFHLVPLGFTCEPRPDSVRLAPTYPVGLPLQFALAGVIAGWRVGPYLVGVGGALAAVWLCYRCARELGVSPPLALVGAAALGISPMFLFVAIQPLSDAIAATWCVAAAYFALRAHRATGYGWAFACGLACALAVLVRPTNVLVLPAMALLVGRGRQLLMVALGGVPGAAFLLLYQKHLYGNAFTSGYGSIFDIFERSSFAPTMQHYAVWLPRLLCPAFLGFGLLAVMRWREDARVLAALFLWAVPVFIFYAFYVVTKEVWWCLRFVLPAFPALILAGLLGLDHFARRSTRSLAIATVALGGWVAAQSIYWGRHEHVLGPSQGERTYILAGDWARANLPPNAAVATMVTSGALFYYTDLAILRWDSMTAEEFETYALALQRTGRPLYAVLMDLEEADAFKDHLHGKWQKIADVKTARIWKWTGPP